MDNSRLAAIALVVAGGLALAYGGFSYTRATHTADLGSVHLEVNERSRVNVPLWAGIGAVLIGGIWLVAGLRR